MLDMAESCLAAMVDDFPRMFLPGVTATDLAINVQRGEIERFLLPPEQLDGFPDGAKLGMGTAYFLANQVDVARSLYESVRPDLFALPPNPVAPGDVTDALVVAGMLQESGEIEHALVLTSAVEETLARLPGSSSVGAFTPTILALGRSEYQAAAEALLTATETSAMQSWWIFLAPAFAADTSNPDFAAALDRLREEIAHQRDAYRANPDLPPY